MPAPWAGVPFATSLPLPLVPADSGSKQRRGECPDCWAPLLSQILPYFPLDFTNSASSLRLVRACAPSVRPTRGLRNQRTRPQLDLVPTPGGLMPAALCVLCHCQASPPQCEGQAAWVWKMKSVKGIGSPLMSRAFHPVYGVQGNPGSRSSNLLRSSGMWEEDPELGSGP